MYINNPIVKWKSEYRVIKIEFDTNQICLKLEILLLLLLLLLLLHPRCVSCERLTTCNIICIGVELKDKEHFTRLPYCCAFHSKITPRWFVGAFEKLRKATVMLATRACMPVCPHGTTRVGYHWTDFHDTWLCLGIFLKSADKIQVVLK
jgi:hypothetical protein